VAGELLYKEEVYAITGAAMEVYNVLGPGFLEGVYQDALEIELGLRQIEFRSQAEIRVRYKGRALSTLYKPDLIAFNKIVVELKALERLTTREEAQLLNYLKATGMEAGVLINFGGRSGLDWKRMVFTKK